MAERKARTTDCKVETRYPLCHRASMRNCPRAQAPAATCRGDRILLRRFKTFAQVHTRDFRL